MNWCQTLSFFQQVETLSPIPLGVVVVYTIVFKFDCGESISVVVVVVVVQFSAILIWLETTLGTIRYSAFVLFKFTFEYILCTTSTKSYLYSLTQGSQQRP